MYCISEQQIDYILNDIGARGVEMEDLQLNLLDHICCIIEQRLEENGDFEHLYSQVIQQFYKNDLREIEEETISLLTNKNYYVMKKIMLYSGTFSAATLSTGIILKYMHSPGASAMIVSGILSASLIFIPLLFALKVKEKQSGKDKLLVGLGTLSAITIAMGILFKIMHWPYANVLATTSPAILMLVFLPIYFFTGVRNAETKVNTIVTSILMIVGCGLFFSLTITPQGSRTMSIRTTEGYLRNEQLLKGEVQLLAKANKPLGAEALDQKIYAACEELKVSLLEWETGYKTLGEDFVSRNALIKDHATEDFFKQNGSAASKLAELNQNIYAYNQLSANRKVPAIPIEATVVDANAHGPSIRVRGALDDLIRIQMLVLQNERALAML